MNHPDTQKWVKLSFDLQKDIIFLHYEDGYGNKADNHEDARQADLKGFPFVMYVPRVINTYFLACLRAEPVMRDTSEGLKNIPLAVFIQVNREWDSYLSDEEILRALQSDKLIFDLFYDVPPNRDSFQLVCFIEGKPAHPLKLPVNIRFAGPDSAAIMDIITQEYWYRNNPQLDTYGLNLRSANIFDIPDDTDILLLQDNEADIFFRYFDGREYPLKPGFIIVIDPFTKMQLRWRVVERYGVPCLYLNYNDFNSALRYLRDFFYCIIHDFHIHEAVNYANNRSHEIVESVLFASPAFNQALRMSTAMESFKQQVNDYAKIIRPGNTTRFLNKFDDNAFLKGRLSENLPSDQLNNFFDEAKQMDIYFHGERTGLVPLSEQQAYFASNKNKFDDLKLQLENMVNDPDIFNAIHDRQERKVDITLDRFNESLVYVPVSKNYSLKAGDQYRLNVIIGQVSKNSLMTGDIPAIDPLLPDPKDARGHELEIVVFPKDFTLLSEARQTVYLPLLGGTNPVSFNLYASEPNELAELRVIVFHENHLLQAFLMNARVDDVGKYYENEALTVSLDLSTSSRFTNIDKLKPRDLYIGLNKNGNATHQLLIKQDSFTRDFGLTEAVLDKAQVDFRELLTNAYFSGNQVRFPDFAISDKPTTEEFYEEIRKFARFGSLYYKQLLGVDDQAFQDKLDDLRGSYGKAMQIGRHNQNYAFPWPMLYDYSTPDDDEIKFPVCTGQPFAPGEYDAYKCDPGRKGCPHNPTIQTFCTQGFWGIRHKVEQLIGSDPSIDFTDSIKVNHNSRILYSYNIKDNVSASLNKKMAVFDPQVQTIDASSDLMGLLWNPDTRPISLIVLGHLDIHEKKGASILTFPEDEWNQALPIPGRKYLNHDLLSNYRIDWGRWKDEPLPLVFLIGCGSGAINLRSLDSIVKGFSNAGASAIIGAECDIASGLGVRFISEVLDSIFTKKLELGEAIRLFNISLFESGIPHAFVFTCYGNNNLKISRL